MSTLTLRPAVEADVERAGDVTFVAFYHAALTHGAVPAVASPLESRRYLRHLVSLDPLGGVVAEDDGDLVGVGWLHKRGPVATIGPLAVHPSAQGRGVGRKLLERCLEMAGQGMPQVRLVQESYNAVSLGLYLRAGFRIVAPVLELELPGGVVLPPVAPGAGVTIRAARGDDRARLVARDARAFGAERPQSVDLYLARGRVLIAERGGTMVGYAFGIGFQSNAYLGSASAEDADVLLPLLATLAIEMGAGEVVIRTHVPATDRRLVAGLVQLGFRVFRAAHYMVRGGGTPPPPNYVLMNGDMM